MTISVIDLLDELRTSWLDDAGSSIRQPIGNYEYQWEYRGKPRWTNVELSRYLNWALSEIGKRNPRLDNTTTSVVQIAVVAGTRTYAYDPAIMTIEEVSLNSNGRPLIKTTRQTLENSVFTGRFNRFSDVDWRAEEGDVTHYMESEHNRTLSLWKVPDSADTLNLIVYRRLTDGVLAPHATGISKSQTPGGAGDLTLNGIHTAAGVATLAYPTYLCISSPSNESALTFTITGTDFNGDALVEAVTGPNANTVRSLGEFATVTQIAVDAASNGPITVGNAIGGTLREVSDNLRQALLAGIAYRAFLKDNGDTAGMENAKMALAEFNQWVGEPVDERTLETRRLMANLDVQIAPPPYFRSRTRKRGLDDYDDWN